MTRDDQPLSGGQEQVARASHIQRLASDPGASAWVGASAGSGKTKVLIDRMLRLLVDGAEPHRILALTFTNTAAAEMANRLQAKLAEWAVMARAKLAEELKDDLLQRSPSEEELARAQALFARVLEAPGGMKIQTIHSFCQSLLGRFPVESQTPPRFRLLDDRGRAELLNQELTELIQDAYQDPDGDMGRAATLMTGLLQDTRFRDAMLTAANKRARLHRLIGQGLPVVLDELRGKLGVDLNQSRQDLILSAIGPEPVAAFRPAWQTLSQGAGKSITKFLLPLAALIDGSADLDEAWEAACKELLSNGGAKIRDHHFPSRSDAEAFPAEIPALRSFQDGVKRTFDALQAQELYRANEAFLTLLAELLTRFERAKLARSLLDFDDLIERAGLLLKEGAIWVHYKLDQGLDHILVDEAQDTNPAQWAVVRGLADLFFDLDQEASERRRSLFVVGDEKQSIFSFQQADPREFGRMRKYFAERAKASDQRFEDLSLDVSFRSVPAILQAVNRVFEPASVHRGVIDEAANAWPSHQAARADEPGSLTLWPSLETDKPKTSKKKGVGDAVAGEESGWVLPLVPKAEVKSDSALARALAQQIAYWCNDPQGLDDPDCYLTIKPKDSGGSAPLKRRRIQPGDILVLVRNRTAFVAELNAQLKGLGVSQIAGRDRMRLAQQLAVQDLLALARFLVLPDDDLTLAGLLKSPLLEVSEEALFTLADGRGKSSLWERLASGDGLQAAPELGRELSDARRFLRACLDRADAVPLYELFVWVLGQHNGRAKLLHRLGLDAEDAIDEFLNLAMDYDAQHPPSLQGFLKWMEGDDVEIKRDMEAGDGKLRIMTVHGSKGLQAPIVVLPLIWTKKKAGDGWLFDQDEMPLWLPNKESAETYAQGLVAEADQREDEEQRRLLYVAMTRASDRLLVCGAETQGKGWYDLVAGGLKDVLTPGRASAAQVEARLPEPPQEFNLLQERAPALSPDALLTEPAAQAEQGAAARKGMASTDAPPLPAWLSGPVPDEPQPPRPLKPSEQEAPPSFFRLVGDAQRAVERGIQIHRLLQYLPELPEDQRLPAMDAYLAKQSALSDQEHQAISDDVQQVLENSALAFVFGPGSRAEVPLSGQVGKDLITGRIDRLFVGAERIVIVDFKTGAPPNGAHAPNAYARQLALYAAVLRQIYPGRAIEAYLVWSRNASIMPVAV